MSKKPTFLNKKAVVASLVIALSTAGAIDVVASEAQPNSKQLESGINLKSNSALDNKDLVLEPAESNNGTTRTAGHSSHSSHSSHGSHASHSSHSSSAY